MSVTVSAFKGFGSNATGFETFEPINVIIGRNNAGKSALIDLLDLCVTSGKSYAPLKHARAGAVFDVRVTTMADENTLKNVFSANVRGGGIPGASHWDYGRRFIDRPITRTYGPEWQGTVVSDDLFVEIGQDRADRLQELSKRLPWPFANVRLLRMAAERDVQSESRSGDRTLAPNGVGTTNLVRAFINSDDLPRHEVEVGLLGDLNTIYQGDTVFQQILCREDQHGTWEIFLREEEKGDIRLSQSGSSLKSIFILLCLMRLVPKIEPVDWSKTILAIEEPENNLHPSLLRRLLNFLAASREKHNFALIITTHSPVGIDWAAKREDSQIIHVQHRGGQSTARTVIGYEQRRDILDDLDVRASDILQANGVIWVEGPSDRIYLKRWLDIVSNNRISEGVHYSIMFYGGKVLSHFNALPPDESEALVSLISLNRNAALLMDSDRHLGGGKTKSGKPRKPRMHLNATKMRIKEELERIHGYVWVTQGREVENYIPIGVYSRLVNMGAAATVSEFDSIVELPMLAAYKENKVALAHGAAPLIELSDVNGHLDLRSQLDGLIRAIYRWNGI